MNLTTAAHRLGINAEVLRRHCAAGRVPGAFQIVRGGRWILPDNILEIMQNTRGPALRTVTEATQCQSASEEKRGGSTSPHQAARELDDLLTQRIAGPRKNCTTN